VKVKKAYIALGVIVAGALFFVLYQFFTGTMFLYRSQQKIEEKLLRKTPVGTSLKEVREYLEGTDFSVRVDIGFGHHIDSGPRRGESVGDHSITVDLGEYHIPPWEAVLLGGSFVEFFFFWIFSEADVVAFWIFENGAVTEILVRKEYEGL